MGNVLATPHRREGNTEMTASRVIVALDVPDAPVALALAHRLDPANCRVKVGKELFTAAGPGLLESLMRAGFEVFLDLKFHDIPNTVASACRVAARLGVWMLNVHASGGRAMMEAARAAVSDAKRPPLLIAVTLLTSMGEQDMHAIGMAGGTADAVLRLATLAQGSGLDGVVCSAQEAKLLRECCGTPFVLVTPGIRPGGTAMDDQSRVMTPSAAILAGADYLVIGRPVTRADSPAEALAEINREVELALEQRRKS
jgi:orotidine-5'-phosphate decarboxylase